MRKKMLSVCHSEGMRFRRASAIQGALYDTFHEHDGNGNRAQTDGCQIGTVRTGPFENRNTLMETSQKMMKNDLTEKCMLVVDSSAPVFFAYRIQFERQGVIIDACETHGEALELLATHAYDVALIDINQAGVLQKDDLDLVSLLRERRPDVKIILMTGSNDADGKKKAAALGAALYFERPVLSSTVFRALKELGIIN